MTPRLSPILYQIIKSIFYFTLTGQVEVRQPGGIIVDEGEAGGVTLDTVGVSDSDSTALSGVGKYKVIGNHRLLI